MTNCTAPGVTLDTIPVMEGHWRQNPSAQYVRMCDGFAEACLGGEIAGDTSCADGHTGPLCDLCKKDPLHFGGRGAPCQSCSDAGDPKETISVIAAASSTFRSRGAPLLWRASATTHTTVATATSPLRAANRAERSPGDAAQPRPGTGG